MFSVLVCSFSAFQARDCFQRWLREWNMEQLFFLIYTDWHTKQHSSLVADSTERDDFFFFCPPNKMKPIIQNKLHTTSWPFFPSISNIHYYAISVLRLSLKTEISFMFLSTINANPFLPPLKLLLKTIQSNKKTSASVHVVAECTKPQHEAVAPCT